MKDDRKESTPLEQGADTAAHAARAAQQAHRIADYARSAETVAHTSQAAYAVTTAAQGGATAAGAATGTALAGPLGTIVGALLTSKTFWNIIVGILAFIFLWMFIIANMIGIILSYLGFADANSFANEAQSAQLSNMRTRIEQVLANEDYEKEILAIIEQNRDLQIQEINADKAENYADYEVQIVDEYETKLKRNLSSYLAVFLTETWDNSSIQSFLGYPNSLGLDMSTDLTSPYDAYFQEAAQTYNVPVALLIAMGKVESDFNPNATSGAGAMGIMQLMPATAASLGVSNPYDPRQNIMGGAKYIAGNIEQFKNYSNGLELAIAAYNAGPGAVIKYGYQIPPYEETQNYVKKVLGYIEIQEGRISSGGNSDESTEDLSAPYGQLKEAVSENVDRFFDWSVTDEKESEVTETAYYFLSESGKTEIEKATYDQLKREGANVTTEAWPTNAKMVEYTIALMLNSQLSGSGSGFEYKYVTDQGTFELVIKVLKVLQDGVQALKDSFFSLFSWTDFVTGGSSTDSYIGNIDATGDIITYNTVGKGVKHNIINLSMDVTHLNFLA